MPGTNPFMEGSNLDIMTPSSLSATEVLDFLNDEPDTIIPKKKEVPQEQSKDTSPKTPEQQNQKSKGEEPVKTGPVSPNDILGEEEETDSEEEINEEEDKEQTQEDTEESVFSTISKELVTLGIFTLEEGETEVTLNTPEEFAARWDLESRKKAGQTIDTFLGRFGEDYKDMFQSVYVDGMEPKEYLERYTKIQDIASLDLTDEASQEKVVREALRSQRRKQESIDRAVEKFKNYGDLEEEAKEAKEFLIQKEAADLEASQEAKKQEIQRKADIKREYINNISRILTDKLNKKEFDGIPVNKQFADEVGGYITREKYQTAKGEPITEFDKDIIDLNRPENHEKKIKVAMLLRIMKDDPTLSKITKRAISKDSNTVFSNLKNKMIKTGDDKAKKQEQPQKDRFFS